MRTGIAPSVLLAEDDTTLVTLFEEAMARDEREVKLHGG